MEAQRMHGDVPMPVVNLARGFHVVIVLVAFAAHAPWLIAVDVALLLAGLLGGPRWSLFGYAGRAIFASRLKTADFEAAPLARFNNGIAVTFFILALVMLALHVTILGWIFAGIIALASASGMCGFCIGCFLFYRFRLSRYRLFGN